MKEYYDLLEKLEKATEALIDYEMTGFARGYIAACDIFLSDYASDGSTLMNADLSLYFYGDHVDGDIIRLTTMSKLIADYQAECFDDYDEILCDIQRADLNARADRLLAVAKMAEEAASAVRFRARPVETP